MYLTTSMGFLNYLCCCFFPRDYGEYDVILGLDNIHSKVHAEKIPIQVNGGSQDSIFLNIRNKMSSWSLPKSQSIREERIHKFDEFLSQESQELQPFDDQEAVSVTSRLSEILE